MIQHATVAEAASIVVSAFACQIKEVHGYHSGATDAWLQIFDAKQLPADTTVPVAVYPLYATAPFQVIFPVDLNLTTGCVVVVSSTAATLTVSAQKITLFAFGSSTAYVSSVTVAGKWSDSASADDVDYLDVFTSAAMLYEIRAKQKTDIDAPIYVQVFFDKQYSELVPDETIPDLCRTIADGDTDTVHVFAFGKDGKALTKCCVSASLDPEVYSAPVGTGDSLYIEAVYK